MDNTLAKNLYSGFFKRRNPTTFPPFVDTHNDDNNVYGLQFFTPDYVYPKETIMSLTHETITGSANSADGEMLCVHVACLPHNITSCAHTLHVTPPHDVHCKLCSTPITSTTYTTLEGDSTQQAAHVSCYFQTCMSNTICAKALPIATLLTPTDVKIFPDVFTLSRIVTQELAISHSPHVAVMIKRVTNHPLHSEDDMYLKDVVKVAAQITDAIFYDDIDSYPTNAAPRKTVVYTHTDARLPSSITTAIIVMIQPFTAQEKLFENVVLPKAQQDTNRHRRVITLLSRMKYNSFEPRNRFLFFEKDVPNISHYDTIHKWLAGQGDQGVCNTNAWIQSITQAANHVSDFHYVVILSHTTLC